MSQCALTKGPSHEANEPAPVTQDLNPVVSGVGDVDSCGLRVDAHPGRVPESAGRAVASATEARREYQRVSFGISRQ